MKTKKPTFIRKKKYCRVKSHERKKIKGGTIHIKAHLRRTAIKEKDDLDRCLDISDEIIENSYDDFMELAKLTAIINIICKIHEKIRENKKP